MLDDSADVVESEFAQVGVPLPGKEWFAVFPDALVTVHPRAVVSEERFGHECRCFPVTTGHVAHDIFIEVHLVTRADQRVEADIDLGLSSGRNFVVLPLNLHTEIFQHQGDLVADILLSIGRGYWEVTLLVADLISGVRHFFATAVEDALGGVDLIKGAP